MKQKKEKTVRCTSIGGQAVLEGVMMRGRTSVATAVRDQDGIIRLESERITPADKKPLIFRLPIIRGCINFFSSLIMGTKILMRSAEVYGEGEPSNFEKWLSEKCKIDLMSIVIAFSVFLGLALSLGLFVLLPQFLYEIAVRPLFKELFNLENIWVQTVSEGVIRILIFVGYIFLTSLLKDIRRVYQYHGAEHKTISCYEAGLDLTVDNVRTCTRVHNRCGTTFMFFVMIVSILVIAVVRTMLEPVLPTMGQDGFTLNKLYQTLIRIACIPFIAGLSYELLKGLAKTNNPIFAPLKAPGLLLQRLTTREPEDEMIEVAIKSFTTVLEMDADETIPVSTFVTAQKYGDLRTKTQAILKDAGVEEDAELDWIFCEVLSVKREQLSTIPADKLLSPLQVEKIESLVKERATGKPLSYVLGTADFYGYLLKVNENVLIPRPETELLAEKVIAEVQEGDTVLDLCTGSGAIAIAVAKQSKAVVTASDVSENALSVATENAEKVGAQIQFVYSDLFKEIEGKFRIIVSNPPYIKSEDISSLQSEVKNYEPILALDGGEDGLDFYREICKQAPDYLEEGGLLFFEVGEGQATAVFELLAPSFTVTVYPDYAGIDRMIRAEKK